MKKSQRVAAQNMLDEVLRSEGLTETEKAKLKEVEDALRSPIETDVWIYRTVVLILGFAIVATVLGGILLEWHAKSDATIQLPESLIAIASAAVGALAGLLAPRSRGDS